MTRLRTSRRTWPAAGIAVVLVALALVVAACGESATTTTMSSAASETTVSSSTSTSVAPATSETTGAASEKTLVDMGGNTVVVPATVNRIAITCEGGAAQEVAVLGGADKIVALPSSLKKFTTLLKAYPRLGELPEVGTFDNVGIEALVKLDPDVVIASKGSKLGNEAIKNVGIPVVGINCGANREMAGCEKEFKLIGELLGNPQAADNLVSFWDQQLETISRAVESVPADAKVRVYYARGGSTLTFTEGGEGWVQALITAAGGINVAESLGSATDTDLEQVIKWNPEVMIVSTSLDMSVSDVMNNSRLRSIEAVKNNRVFLCPVGGFSWHRPGPEAILGATWLAKTLYPKECADIDLERLTKDFFKRFYGYDLSTAELEALLAPTS